MRSLYDPTTAIIGLTAFTSLAGGVAQGVSAQQQAEARAIDAEAQQTQAQIATQRDLRDLRKQRSRQLARTRAALAAQGADLTSGTPLALQGAQEAEFNVQETRIRQDSRVTQETLRTRAANARSQGDAAFASSVASGFANAAGGATTSLLARQPRTSGGSTSLQGRVSPGAGHGGDT
jgi:Skp family chaperone for outer membrane proteins